VSLTEIGHVEENRFDKNSVYLSSKSNAQVERALARSCRIRPGVRIRTLHFL
jgi:hypothetical protein